MKLGRNDPCVCGSGRKYKNCCLDRISPEELQARTQTALLKPILGKDFQELMARFGSDVPAATLIPLAAAGYALVDWCIKAKMKGPQPPSQFKLNEPDAGVLLAMFTGPEADQLMGQLVYSVQRAQGRLRQGQAPPQAPPASPDDNGKPRILTEEDLNDG